MRDADVILVVYDKTNKESFDNCDGHLKNIHNIYPDKKNDLNNEHPLLFLVGNKSDLEDYEEV